MPNQNEADQFAESLTIKLIVILFVMAGAVYLFTHEIIKMLTNKEPAYYLSFSLFSFFLYPLSCSKKFHVEYLVRRGEEQFLIGYWAYVFLEKVKVFAPNSKRNKVLYLMSVLIWMHCFRVFQDHLQSIDHCLQVMKNYTNQVCVNFQTMTIKQY